MSSKSKTSRAKSTAVLSTMVLLGICTAFVPKAWGRYSGGGGIPAHPYRIATPQDLNDIGNHQEDWNKYFILINDINLVEYTGKQFNRIGTSSNAFTGVFDGNDHKICNFTWDSNGINYVGLFGYVAYGGQIKNLGMVNLDIDAVNGVYIGGLVGFNHRTIMITNCYTTGSVTGKNAVGGLVGANDYYGMITNCFSTVSVSGYINTGGLVGHNTWAGTITDCYFSGSVSGYIAVGAIVGENSGTITNSHSMGIVIGNGRVGGLVGFNLGTITDCYSTDSITGYGVVGGLVGHNERPGTITNCYSTGNVMGTQAIGGLVGFNHGMITNCYSTGSVSGTTLVGGMIGSDYVGKVETSFWDIETSGEPNSAGGTPKTTSEMKTRSTFTDAGWDFVEIWGIGENQTYPYLRFAPAGDFNYDKKVDLFDLAILASHWLEGY